MKIDYKKKITNLPEPEIQEEETKTAIKKQEFKPVEINYDDPSATNTYRYASKDEEIVNDDFGPTGPNTYQEPEGDLELD